ncbi:putative E6 [Hibiscus syriacus]|uniref:E6 n=1 Tax=Hibiscus syriacus TaxID=106335 RepID=A0A6A3CC38_HIBSY|nr:putative E6 [Hibiscus syriacus]
MEESTLEQKLHDLAHILTSPTISPPLQSQLFISTQIPCFLNWDLPPILCNKPNSHAFPPPPMGIISFPQDWVFPKLPGGPSALTLSPHR